MFSPEGEGAFEVDGKTQRGLLLGDFTIPFRHLQSINAFLTLFFNGTQAVQKKKNLVHRTSNLLPASFQGHDLMISLEMVSPLSALGLKGMRGGFLAFSVSFCRQQLTWLLSENTDSLLTTKGKVTLAASLP